MTDKPSTICTNLKDLKSIRAQIPKTVKRNSSNENCKINNKNEEEGKEKDNNSTTSKGKVMIQDLCPEEKLKIGELIEKLAEEKKEKDGLLQKIGNLERIKNENSFQTVIHLVESIFRK